MQTTFHVLGPAHLVILTLVPLLAAVLVVIQKRYLHLGKAIRYCLASLLMLCTVIYNAGFVAAGQPLFPRHLPLELCDMSLWLAIFTLFLLKPAVFDVLYYWALAGASMALLTPNLIGVTRFVEVMYFLSHGLTVAAVLYLVWTRQARPRPGSVRRAMVWTNIAAIPVGIFDYIYKTDYMYLCTKPAAASLMDLFGPWPWYIVVCEGVGLGLFLLLYLPFWRKPMDDPARDEDAAEFREQT